MTSQEYNIKWLGEGMRLLSITLHRTTHLGSVLHTGRVSPSSSNWICILVYLPNVLFACVEVSVRKDIVTENDQNNASLERLFSCYPTTSQHQMSVYMVLISWALRDAAQKTPYLSTSRPMSVSLHERATLRPEALKPSTNVNERSSETAIPRSSEKRVV